MSAGNDRPVAGMGFAALGAALIATIDAVVKWLSDAYSVIQILFVIQIGASPALWLMAARSGGWAALKVRRPWVQLARAVLFFGAGIGLFTAFGSMALADVYAVAFAAPLAITVLAALMLREPAGWPRWLAVIVGFSGVLIMLQPGSDWLHIGVLAALGGMLCLAVNAVLVRRLAPDDGPIAMMFYNFIVVAALSGAMLPFGFFKTPTLHDLGLMALAGLLDGFAQAAQIQGYRLAPAAVAAPMQYTQLLWGVLYGVLLFGDVPSAGLIVGSAMVISSGIFLLYREARRSEPSVITRNR